MSQDYSIELSAERAVLRGVMRLHSAEAYDEALTQVRQAIDAASGPYTLDFSQVVFLNSSGIRGLAGLVIAAKERRRVILIIGNASVAWQVRTLPSFQALDPTLTVTLV